MLTSAPELLPVKQTLLLGENKIQHFPYHYFDAFEVLTVVNIANNEIYSTPNIGYIRHSLLVFDISNNSLNTLDNRQTGGMNMTVLENLMAQNNEIKHFEVAILTRMPRLTFLDLGGNLLQHMPDPTAYLHPLNGDGKPLILILNHNPLTCDKGLSWLVVLAQQGRMHPNAGSQAECYSPLCLKGRNIMNLCKYDENLIYRGHFYTLQ